jgi:hypothetical protein
LRMSTEIIYQTTRIPMMFFYFFWHLQSENKTFAIAKYSFSPWSHAPAIETETLNFIRIIKNATNTTCPSKWQDAIENIEIEIDNLHRAPNQPPTLLVMFDIVWCLFDDVWCVGLTSTKNWRKIGPAMFLFGGLGDVWT